MLESSIVLNYVLNNARAVDHGNTWSCGQRCFFETRMWYLYGRRSETVQRKIEWTIWAQILKRDRLFKTILF